MAKFPVHLFGDRRETELATALHVLARDLGWPISILFYLPVEVRF